MTPRFVISLDFELFWGVLDTKSLNDYGAHLCGVHAMFPRLLDLLDHYQVKATFATVGFLFYPDRESLVAAWPQRKPEYDRTDLSPYLHRFATDLYHFAPEIIEELVRRPHHEIASHTFCHYYCTEPGQRLEEFRADLEAARKAAANWGQKLESMVFPRNQVKVEYVEACRSFGFVAYRGNPKSWIYQTSNRSLWGRLLRLIDSYLNVSGDNYTSEADLRASGPIMDIPASAFLRPHRPGLPILDRLKLQRIKKSLTRAAQAGGTYHLWWHPHNFGKHIQENLADLEVILQHFSQLRQQHGMLSQTMSEVARSV